MENWRKLEENKNLKKSKKTKRNPKRLKKIEINEKKRKKMEKIEEKTGSKKKNIKESVIWRGAKS